MATKLAFEKGQVNVSQRLETKDGEIKRANEPVTIKTTVMRPATARPIKAEA